MKNMFRVRVIVSIKLAVTSFFRQPLLIDPDDTFNERDRKSRATRFNPTRSIVDLRCSLVQILLSRRRNGKHIELKEDTIVDPQTERYWYYFIEEWKWSVLSKNWIILRQLK